VTAPIKFQAWLSGIPPTKIGDPMPTEADAWREIHAEGQLLFPQSAAGRRRFEASCYVVVEIS